MSAVGLMIAAPRSGSGKTTLSLGLMRALRRRGLIVASAKSGPDYIDCAFHAAATGRESVNLDSWAMPPDLLQGLASETASGSDVFIAEASMGLFDGVPAAHGRSGASADVAAALGMPVVLIVDVSGQAQSAAAIVKGCMVYDKRIAIGGIVLNRVASERHRRLAADAIANLGMPVLGALPRAPEMALPERHLGLVQASETADLERRLETLADFVSEHVDLDAVLRIARPLELNSGKSIAMPPPGQRIAIARDAAFTFIYPHLLRAWRRAGAEVSYFSPLNDEAPPEAADVCWLPGGYPELHAGALAAAGRFLSGLRQFAASRPVHGECGGYMVMGRTLTDAGGATHAMADLLSVECSFHKRRMTLGYRRIAVLADGRLGRRGAQQMGHEFHYATVTAQGLDEPYALASDAYGGETAPVGSRRGAVTGSFFHVIAGVE